jgi:hypothetical protein
VSEVRNPFFSLMFLDATDHVTVMSQFLLDGYRTDSMWLVINVTEPNMQGREVFGFPFTS